MPVNQPARIKGMNTIYLNHKVTISSGIIKNNVNETICKNMRKAGTGFNVTIKP